MGVRSERKAFCTTTNSPSRFSMFCVGVALIFSKSEKVDFADGKYLRTAKNSLKAKRRIKAIKIQHLLFLKRTFLSSLNSGGGGVLADWGGMLADRPKQNKVCSDSSPPQTQSEIMCVFT